MKRRIKKIADEPLILGESKAFTYYPSKAEKRLVGILFSQVTEISLSFKDGTDLHLSGYEQLQGSKFSPDRRITKVEKELTQEAVKGVLTATNDVQATMYLLLDINHEH